MYKYYIKQDQFSFQFGPHFDHLPKIIIAVKVDIEILNNPVKREKYAPVFQIYNVIKNNKTVL